MSERKRAASNGPVSKQEKVLLDGLILQTLIIRIKSIFACIAPGAGSQASLKKVDVVQIHAESMPPVRAVVGNLTNGRAWNSRPGA